MHRDNGLEYTVALINELNEDNYNLDNFEKDSQVLEKLLKSIGMFEMEEDLTIVLKECNKELRALEVFNPRISSTDKRDILKYL